MNIKQKKAVGYIRVSTSIQVKEGESLSTQRQQIVDYAKNKDWELGDIYSDEGISGAKIEYRTNLKNLIDDAKKGKFEVIIITKLSRFARNAKDYMNLSYELKNYGISLVSIKENIDSTALTGKMMAGFLALFSEWEHNTIKEQMHENKMARWNEQHIFIGMPPYAYYWNKETKQLEINKEEAKVYQLIVDMYLNQKMSFQDIGLKLKEQGIKSKRSDKTEDLIMRDVLICGRCGGRVKPKVGKVRKDGTAPRNYVCYWASTSKNKLIASGRNIKCSLPYIRTKSIENAVWSDIVIMFSLNPNKAFDHLFDPKKQKNKMKQFQERISRLEMELNKKNRAKDNIFALMENEVVNQNDLINRLQINQDEILTIESSLNDTKIECKELANLTEREKDISDFLHNNKNQLREIIKEIRKLSADDRKLLVESMLQDKVTVDYQEDNELDGPGGATCDYNLKWNPDILQRFMNEGKITNLNKNGTDQYPHPSPATQCIVEPRTCRHLTATKRSCKPARGSRQPSTYKKAPKGPVYKVRSINPHFKTFDSGVLRMSAATNTTDIAVKINHSSITPSSMEPPTV
ncbi:MAG: recombinase family protein [Thermodesulfobacteriota bacterium]